MAMQADIQYVPFCYVEGTAARKVERKSAKKATAAPVNKVRRAKRKTVAVDPVAIGGIVIAVVMLVMLLAGFAEYTALQEQTRQMRDYVTSLQLENTQLQHDFDSKVDMDYVQEVADAMGMVSADDVYQISIDVQVPTEEATELTLWESIATFLTGLFA